MHLKHRRLVAKGTVGTERSRGAAQAVKDALHVPVLGNGDVRSRRDADEMMAATGVDGVLSAISLLDDPGLFSDERLQRCGPPSCRLRPSLLNRTVPRCLKALRDNTS